MAAVAVLVSCGAENNDVARVDGTAGVVHFRPLLSVAGFAPASFRVPQPDPGSPAAGHVREQRLEVRAGIQVDSPDERLDVGLQVLLPAIGATSSLPTRVQSVRFASRIPRSKTG